MLSIVIISLEQDFEGSKVSFNQVGVTGRRKSNQILLLEGVCTLHFINLFVKTPEEALRWSFSTWFIGSALSSYKMLTLHSRGR